MNILIVVDKFQSAIHRLAIPVEKHNKHFNIKIFPVHPKRNEASTLSEAQQLLNWADLIDIHYWKSGEVLRLAFPEEFNKKPKVLFHFNPYDLEQMNWTEIYDAVVVGNETMKNHIPYAMIVPYCVDLDFWKFKKEICNDRVVNMSVARIESKKGVLEVAKACKELGYKFVLAGRVSEPEYVKEIFREGGDKFEFHENVTDEELREIYYYSAVHVCNSADNFESGTLPVLENMACGTPVIARPVGHIPDLFNEKNLVLNMGTKDNVENLKTLLKEVVENKAYRMKLREEGWQTVKNRNEEKMARMISGIYYKMIYKDAPFVSVIIPAYDNPNALVEAIAAAVNQSYRNVEVVVVDSGKMSMYPIIRKFRSVTQVPIKYFRFKGNGYTLPKARNIGVMESEGEILVFCDERISMNVEAVKHFVMNHGNNCWLWGVKDDSPKGFVENFSSVGRTDFIRHGLFNERINCYGGATQEIRTRFENMNGFVFQLVNEAKAKGSIKSHSKRNKKEDIVRAKFNLYKLYGE